MGRFVVGAGGHGKVVLSLLQACGLAVEAVLDDASFRWGETLLGVPVTGPTELLLGFDEPRAVLAVGGNACRLSLARRFSRVHWETAIHPRAWVHESVRIGPGTVVFAGAILQPGTEIGAHCIVNTGALADHDCRIGEGVHLAPGTCLAGGVTLGKGVFFGVRSAAIPGVSVGDWTVVGAGGVVVRDLPERVVAVGVPARPLRTLRKEEAPEEE
jgi:UDP-perosamine 4-acetyltransferase